MNIRTEDWQGYKIRFVEEKGEWWAILKDLCDALNLRTDGVAQRLDSDMMIRVAVERDDPISNVDNSDNKRGAKTLHMIAVNEVGIYEALFASRRLEARQLRRWTATVLQKLRNQIGLQGYEVMRMTEKDIQDDIDHFLDTLFYDEETGKLMMSVTVAGGDVEQVEFEDQDLFI